ncbi:zf-HC2 domain-containing protein [Anaeromyxobacter paludicola]|uniref:Putative zinc-finger domain-containing protein n=1 Tax=Anaeromyxobacter paludicola TaxID=2918171 RepID=A0ABM7XCR8_9BACT|nr:zf-HC2 domain-containing protein [Anaeromyxobacter paludicola]BDG09623.1 hypothetical protein AMPC_27360 [Anaeromyxobacter paludicola]
MSACVRFAPMLTARRGELSAEEQAGLAGHLAGCARCRAIQKDLLAVEGVVGYGLTRAAAARDFSGFAEGVLARLEAAPADHEGALRRLAAWFRAHRALAFGAAMAPVAAALALYLLLPGAGPENDLDVVTEGRSATVLRTSDGPVVLIGSDEPT